jgi:hypothetical protein
MLAIRDGAVSTQKTDQQNPERVVEWLLNKPCSSSESGRALVGVVKIGLTSWLTGALELADNAPQHSQQP